MSNRFPVSLSDLEAEQSELRGLEDTRDYLLIELTRLQERYDEFWKHNRRLARRISRPSALEQYYLRRAEDYRLPALERYISRLTTQRLMEERAAPLREEQDKVIAELWRLIAQRRPIQTDIANLTLKIRQLEDHISRKIVYEHTTMTANVDTETEGTRLIISITLDYDAPIEKRENYRKAATAKIRRWFLNKFENVWAEPSVEVSDTPNETVMALMEAREEVTDIHYVWYWRREGTYTSPGEQDEGDIKWDQEIPTISEADLWGWKKKPEPRRKFKEGFET